MSVLPYSAANYNDMFREGGRDDLVDDERVLTIRARLANADSLYAELVPIVGQHRTAHWVDFCDRHDIPCAAVRTLDELVDELPIVEHPRVGRYRSTPSPVHFSTTPAGLRRHAPRLGEHGREVLLEAGLGDDEVDALQRSGALRHV